MPVSIDLTPILALPFDERLEIMHAIWDSIAADTEPRELSDEMKAFLDQRLQDARDNPDDVVSWEEVKAAALARAQARR